MTTVTSKLSKNGKTYINAIAYNAIVATPLGKHIVKDFYSIETEEPLTNEDDAVKNFNPKQWSIRESEFVSENSGETLTTKWLADFIG